MDLIGARSVADIIVRHHLCRRKAPRRYAFGAETPLYLSSSMYTKSNVPVEKGLPNVKDGAAVNRQIGI